MVTGFVTTVPEAVVTGFVTTVPEVVITGFGFAAYAGIWVGISTRPGIAVGIADGMPIGRGAYIPDVPQQEEVGAAYAGAA
ncbi:hypothetical protein FRUB_07430 [Fimbriiglobus ruber]|uniref:Uncharacterized protein n=1 Tax=Fimbriiglobus ruber TaxID=1908690 RepID=A0A225D9M7_9BACT|nr:hypothetical protein FRUB_07430 [Fimbriiglobus ruber]